MPKIDLASFYRSGYPALAVETHEDKRALQECISQGFSLLQGGEPIFNRILIWSSTRGFQRINYSASWQKKLDIDRGDELVELESAIPSLMADENKYEHSLIIFQDVHMYQLHEYPRLNRLFKDFILYCEEVIHSCVIFLGVEFKPPKEWEKLVTVLDYGLPDEDDLNKVLSDSLASIQAGAGTELKLENGERDALIQAAKGLTIAEAANAFPYSYIKTGRLDVELVREAKMQAVKKSGFMQFIPNDVTFGDIGGLDALKDYVRKRRAAFTKKAREFGLPSPRGVLLCGLPGVGKSLSAKAIGLVLNVPTLRLDFSSLLSSLVGESEKALRQALRLAEAVSPVVLFVDEIEKGLSGSKSELDSGVSRRMLGYFLTWMQERKEGAQVYILASANQVESLPPEFLRKGRFDEIFAVDLPSEEERSDIFKIHIKKRGRDPKKFKIDILASEAVDFTGAEIEECVKSGLFEAFDEGTDLADKHILKAIGETIPLATSMKEDIERLRSWIGKRARSASAVTKKKSGGRRIS